MKKDLMIELSGYNINLITNGAEDFKQIVLCFHGFNGDKWGDAYSGLKKRMKNALVCSFDSCGHGDSEVSSEEMRLDTILKEIDAVLVFLKNAAPGKPISLVAVSYGAYRVMQYLIKYSPKIQKVVYVNPAFRMLDILEKLKEFKYSALGQDDKVVMKRSLGKFLKKDFLDDLHQNSLYQKQFNLSYETRIVVGERDSLIPIEDTLEIAKKYNYETIYVDDDHCFENKDNWQVVVDLLERGQ